VQVRVGCEFLYQAAVDTASVLQVEPRPDGDHELLSETWELEPHVDDHTYIDSFGNLCRRLSIPSGSFRMRYDAEVEVTSELDDIGLDAEEVPYHLLPDDALVYTLPSRYCLSDLLADDAWKLFGATPPGWSRVQAICDWVHDEIRFGYGASTPITTAVDVFESRHGVCRDFAHLAITFCRAMSIPSRYAFGYLPDIGVPPPDDPMDFCAWMEVYVGGRWWTFDPRNNQRRVGRVLIGRGRDALDVAMVTTFGNPLLQSMVVWADESNVSVSSA
jgi:transglutaminase-like putative cysteine protease